MVCANTFFGIFGPQEAFYTVICILRLLARRLTTSTLVVNLKQHQKVGDFYLNQIYVLSRAAEWQRNPNQRQPRRAWQNGRI